MTDDYADCNVGRMWAVRGATGLFLRRMAVAQPFVNRFSALLSDTGFTSEHGGIGLENQLVEQFTIFRVQRHAKAGADLDLAVFPWNGQVDGLADFMRDALDIASLMRAVEQHYEFVTAHARGYFELANIGFDGRAYVDQDGIACLVAKTIIDLLEMIQVDIAQGQMFSTAFCGQQLLTSRGNKTIAIG